MKRSVPSRRGFTLIELLVAMVIFVSMLGMSIALLAGVQQTWAKGERNAEISQNTRAVLELFSRELSQAIVSPRMQFVQNPGLNASATPLVPDLAPVAPSLFWMMPGPTTDSGRFYEVGYFLTRNDTTHTYNLNRFYVPPTDTSHYLGNDDYGLGPTSPATAAPSAFAQSALWLTKLSPNAFLPTASTTATSVVADGVIAMWIRCLDSNGNSIPWLNASTTVPAYPLAGTIQFCSGAGFEMAPVGVTLGNGATFAYTPVPTSTSSLVGNRLPASVEITIVMLDSRTLARKPTIPAMPTATTPDDIPNQVIAFRASLIQAKLASAKTYTTRVKLYNATL